MKELFEGWYFHKNIIFCVSSNLLHAKALHASSVWNCDQIVLERFPAILVREARQSIPKMTMFIFPC